jgi:hypothetical protein
MNQSTRSRAQTPTAPAAIPATILKIVSPESPPPAPLRAADRPLIYFLQAGPHQEAISRGQGSARHGSGAETVLRENAVREFKGLGDGSRPAMPWWRVLAVSGLAGFGVLWLEADVQS